MQVKRESVGLDMLPKRAGLFGVVLLCALPTLLSLPAPAVPHAASRFNFTPGSGASHADSLLDWTGMDVDGEGASPERHKAHLPLSFLNGHAGAHHLVQGISSGEYPLSPPALRADGETEAEFDVSFGPSSTAGKIRVRIESPSESAVASLTSGRSSPLSSGSPSLAFTGVAEGWDLDFAAPEHAQRMVWDAPAAGANVDVSLFAPPAARRRRVRIALKNGPVAGAEGGEWEVEVR